jgi:DNA-binding transcriptional MocR family regulator
MKSFPPSARKAHTKRVCEWNAQVRHDAGVRHAAYRVASEIADHVNWETNEAWPSQKRLAERTGMSEGHVHASVHNLKERGHLDVTPGKPGRGHSNRYRLILKDRPAEASNAEKPHMAEGSKANSTQSGEVYRMESLSGNCEKPTRPLNLRARISNTTPNLRRPSGTERVSPEWPP